MTKPTLIVVCIALALALGAARKTFGQVPTDKSVDASADDKNPAEPNWMAMHAFGNEFYLANVGRVRQEHDRLKKHPYWGDCLLQMLGTEYSYIGRYRRALDCFNRRDFRRAKMGQLTSADQFEPRDAVAAILELADKHQVLMINEAHHVPLHRAFTLQLLEGLYAKGFRYFAAETLSVHDEALQTRGYPTLQTGGYLAEPVYADLIRTALNLGYRITPYECEDAPPQHDTDNPIPAMNIREQGQAKNLKERILDKDPTAKIIVHAGYAHIVKKLQAGRNGQKGELRWMALAFQDLTGIEPFSIDQTEMSECNKPDNENADYRFAIEKGLVKDHPVVLRDKEKSGYFVCAANGLAYDLSVIHPRSRYENGRPTWLAIGGRRSAHLVKTDLRPTPQEAYLAQAFYIKEMGPEAVPIDQMEFAAEEPAPTLWLPPGKMHVRIVDAKGKTLHEYETDDRR